MLSNQFLDIKQNLLKLANNSAAQSKSTSNLQARRYVDSLSKRLFELHKTEFRDDEIERCAFFEKL